MARLAGLVSDEAARQNLVAPSTLATMWSRHIVDSAQLIDFARDMLGAGLQLARGLVPWSELASGCDKAARDLRIAAAGPLRV